MPPVITSDVAARNAMSLALSMDNANKEKLQELEEGVRMFMAHHVMSDKGHDLFMRLRMKIEKM